MMPVSFHGPASQSDDEQSEASDDPYDGPAGAGVHEPYDGSASGWWRDGRGGDWWESGWAWSQSTPWQGEAWHGSWAGSAGNGQCGTYVIGEARAANYGVRGGAQKGEGKSTGKGQGGKAKGQSLATRPSHPPSKGKGSMWRAVTVSAAIEDTHREQTTVPRLITQEHRPDLCEPCRKWGDCSGWFADPFFVFAAAVLLLAQEGDEEPDLGWAAADNGFELQGADSLGGVRLTVETRQFLI